MSRYRTELLIVIGLVFANLAVYAQVIGHDFVNYDDPKFVTGNDVLRSGLTWSNLVWAFTTFDAENWHPVTWISILLDHEVFGLNPGGFHATNVVLHISNCLLLLLVFRVLTGRAWESATVAAIFALHPLHVESVAWVFERKDVLSTFWGLLAIAAYTRYARDRSLGWYGLTALAFALSLMSKPMLVTLPFVLLLLDIWPLHRVNARCVWEKVPLCVLSAITGVLTVLAQSKAGAVMSLTEFSMGVRAANAVMNYVGYIGKAFWPVKLTVFYPHPGKHLTTWLVAAAILVLLAITIACFRWIRERPYVSVGWLWYLGTLVPVIGIVQVGVQAMADRYMYFPLIGLAIILAWGVSELTARWVHQKLLLGIGATAMISLLGWRAWLQTSYWRDSIALFSHALEVTRDNYMAHTSLGVALYERGDVDEAVSHFRRAIAIEPNFRYAHENLGRALHYQGKIGEAVAHLSESRGLRSRLTVSLKALGDTATASGLLEQASKYYSEALDVSPDSAELHNSLGQTRAKLGDLDGAVKHFSAALALDPDFAEARENLRAVSEIR